MTKYPSQMQDKFNLRFPDGMRDAIAERAKANGRSMNSEIVQILQDALDVDEQIAAARKKSGNDLSEDASIMSIEKRLSEIRYLVDEIERLELSNKKPT